MSAPELLERLAALLAELDDALPKALEASTDPQGCDVALALLEVRTARLKLAELEGVAERATVEAVGGDMVQAGGLRIERRRATDRKAWDHDEWQRQVRRKALRRHGLLGAAVIDANGEEVPAGVLHELLATVQGVHGSTSPRSTQLKGLGLDPRDYCESTPGAWRVDVHRDAGEASE